MKTLRTGLAVLLLFALLIPFFPASAQDGANLLKDGGFEGQYTGRGRGDFNIPADWGAWYADSPQTEPWMNLPPVAFPHNGPDPDPHSGNRAMNLNRGFATFTAAIYQQVNVPEGSNVVGSAWAWLHTCDIPDDHEKCNSETDSGAFVRIGIDPNGGTNPNDSDIVWSGNATPHDRWDQISVSATATGGTVTLFLYVTQSVAKELNKVYFDDASLVIGGGGGAAPDASSGDGQGAPPPPPPPPQEVGFVTAQGERDDGSIVHVVQPGDTVDSIAVAYGVTRQQILDLNQLSNPRIIQIGQELLIRPPTEDSDDDDEDEDDDDGGDGSSERSGDESGDGDEASVDPNDAPPAPVLSVASGNVLPSRDPTTTTICLTVFEDVNQNRIHEDGERLLAGGGITLRANGEDTAQYQTDGASEPHCLTDLAAGEYLAVGTAPDGYGLTTPNQLRVQAQPGATIHVTFGAAEGVVPVMIPPPDNLAPAITEIRDEPEAVRANPILDNIGLVVFGLAGAVLVVGTGATLLFRRR